MDKQTEKNLLRIVKENYDAVAPEWGATRKNLRWPELEKYTAQVLGGQSVLDAGCGEGRLARLFAGRRIDYVGVDPSRGLLEIAKKFEANNLRQEFRQGDLLELGKAVTEKFDWVFCVAVLHHIPGKELQLQALKQLKARIKDDGKLVLAVWRPWGWPRFRKQIVKYTLLKLVGKNKMDWGDFLFDWKRGQRSLRYYHQFSRCGLEKLIKQSGLKIEAWEAADKNHYIVLSK